MTVADRPSGPLSDSDRIERARWRSRRGLLELELLLEPFVGRDSGDWSITSLDAYERLLECDDVDVHEWILDRSPAPENHALIVSEIRRFLALDEP